MAEFRKNHLSIFLFERFTTLDIQIYLLRFGILDPPNKTCPKTPQEVWLDV